MSHTEFGPLPSVFSTPVAPDLGCFVERRHGFQEDGDWAIWAEFAPWNTTEGIIPHQCYFRVICGKAAYFQRVKVWMRPQLDPLIFSGINPDHVLGGDFPAYPSDWIKYPPQQGNQTYWFRGEHRDPRSRKWHRTRRLATSTTSTTTAPLAPPPGTTPVVTGTSTTW